MKNILESKQLKAGKSTYLIDLVKHNEHTHFIEIMHSVKSNELDGGSIKIHPDAILPLIQCLQEFQIQILTSEPKELIAIEPEIKDKIQKRYFSMVSIKDIAMQLTLTEANVKAILTERGIEIVPQKLPKKKWFRKRRK